ncbi:16S rRNA (guanine(527)-N(7))-methyltransferase RsmG [Aeromicrobium sp. IC_218]|uniref:16S rRNA (guanine(527)-N(7))-methyltransferase RsmG n=1 Tax=Aeromicrobium sp. IC_218 TaxID=2545468 RepID=UPI001040B51D|nr:16S rRNA (guanine(527)-N(7))-methyltransferase RsmG [Aeromicrobium sp. IC_218]TCJ00563.1 16S rRNA (guanine(527)-N(7))-methyltransferase RsmG [Aeromicrobium sp. IC_218]
MTVSRETTPPPAAHELFGDRLAPMGVYADRLATDGVERGLIGPREVPRLWERHLVNCAVVLPRVAEGVTVADVGTGAGLPGLVWAIARPDLQVTLIETLQRRTIFLQEVVDQLELSNVRVLRSRAEDVHETYDVVTARAVAPLARLGRWCLPLVAPGGVLLALKGRSAADEVDRDGAVLTKLGARSIVVTTYGPQDDPTTVVEVAR